MTILDRCSTEVESRAATGISQSIDFALLSSEENPIPSTRIACLNLFPLLRASGFEPRIAWSPGNPSETPNFPDLSDIIGHGCPSALIFQKIRGPSVIRAIRDAKQRYLPTIWTTCDVVDNEMVREADRTIVVSEYLRSLYSRDLQEKIYVVHDGIENPQLSACCVDRQSKPLRAVMITSQALYSLPSIGTALSFPWTLEIVGRYPNSTFERLRHLYWSSRQTSIATAMRNLKGASSPFVRRTTWNPGAVEDSISRAQIGIIPIDTGDSTAAHGCSEPTWKVKSENRLTLLMGAGLPVIATPIPSYEAVIENGVNGFFAKTPNDWKRCLRRLRCKDFRTEMGMKARMSVSTRYSLSEQARLFIENIRAVSGKN